MELLYQKYISKKNSQIGNPINPIINKESQGLLEFQGFLNDLTSHSIPISILVQKYPELKWCLLNDSIYNLKGFNHVGIENISEHLNGIILL